MPGFGLRGGSKRHRIYVAVKAHLEQAAGGMATVDELMDVVEPLNVWGSVTDRRQNLHNQLSSLKGSGYLVSDRRGNWSLPISQINGHGVDLQRLRRAKPVRVKPGIPYFRDDDLLVDPRPIGKWSIRWCPEEEFAYHDGDQVVEDPERLIEQLEEQARIFRKWVSVGMRLRFEAAVIRDYSMVCPPVYMWETEDPKVAARMVEEAGIVWWRSSIFEVKFDDDEMVVNPVSDTAEADGFEQHGDVKTRAHLIIPGTRRTRMLEKQIEAILEPFGFDLLCGAHGAYNWYVSNREMTPEQMSALKETVIGVGRGKVYHFDIGPANRHDITEIPTTETIGGAA